MNTIRPQSDKTKSDKRTLNAIPIAIGSFPYMESQEALDKIFEYFPQIPLWPQLPNRNPKEQMYIQYFEGMTGMELDSQRKKLTATGIDDQFFESVSEIIMKCMEDDTESFALSRETAEGFYAFLEQKEKIIQLNPFWIKGHITGPVSFCLAVTDLNMKPVLYDETYKEMMVNVLSMKAVWQIQQLKKINENIIIFIDEPYMASFGSSMVALSKEDVTSMITPIIDKIHRYGALAGIHCCGNTDWSVLLKTDCDIISLDAYEYGDNFLLFIQGVTEFIRAGGKIAWGIVPTSPQVDSETAQSLVHRLNKYLDKLQEKGISRETLLKQSFISPSCGLGNVEVQRAEKIMLILKEIHELMQIQ